MNAFSRTFGNVLLVSLLLGLVLPLAAQDTMPMVDPIITVQHVLWENGSEVEGAEAILTRMEHGLAVSFDTAGLEPGDVVTLWWVIFNAPKNCSDGECSFDDVFLMDDEGKYILDGNGQRQPNHAGREVTQVTNLWAAGTLVDEEGGARFQGHLPIGDITGDVLFGNGLTNPMEAEVHLILRTHGPVQPGLLHEQLLTGWGGCPDPFNRAPCADPQIAVFRPPK